MSMTETHERTLVVDPGGPPDTCGWDGKPASEEQINASDDAPGGIIRIDDDGRVLRDDEQVFGAHTTQVWVN